MSKIYVDEILPKDNATVDGSKLSAIPSSAMPTGSVIQHVDNQLKDVTVVGSGDTNIETFITASITPKFANSKIVIHISSSFSITSTLTNFRYLKLYCNGVEVDSTKYNLYRLGFISDGNNVVPITINHNHSPGSTAQQTYTLYINDGGGGGSAVGGRISGSAQTTTYISLTEIAG